MDTMDRSLMRLLNFPLFLLFCGCSSLVSEEKVNTPDLSYPQELEKVNELVQEKKTHDARAMIKSYLDKAENLNWYGHAYFLNAFTYEVDGNDELAVKSYKAAIEHGSQFESAVEAKALYNLSFVYEKMDRRNELVSTLVDLMSRRRYFDALTAQVEIPARLAAAYASEKRLKEGFIFHREASQNYSRLIRSSGFKAKKPEISKSLYYLGFAVYDENGVSYDTLIRKISVGQKYFLASAEASKSLWSEKSVTRLKELYDKAWGMILQHKPTGFDNDALAFKKQQHRRQLVMASDLYDLTYRLQAEEFPMTSVNPRSKKMIDTSKEWVERIEKFALKLDVGPETIRNKKIKNKKLARYVGEEGVKVKVNKEQSSQKKGKLSPEPEEKALPVKQDIGKDPNL
jgi:tetratricopeptide (TPR) repeat protein